MLLRSLAFGLLGFSVLAGPAAARGDGPGGGGGGRRGEAKALGTKADGRGLLRPVVFTRVVSPGSAACARSAGRSAARCRGAATSVAGRSWTHGLPPALGVQAQQCPAGTMATLAEGHDDIVRCIPL
jgi:hypothetical protein